MRLAGPAVLVIALCGCSSTVEVRQSVGPDEAARRMQEGPLVAEALVQGGHRRPLPPGARVGARQVVLPAASGLIVHELGPGDVIELDAQDRIVAVRRGTEPPSWIRFAPGSASSPEGSTEVQGKPADASADATIEVSQADRVELRGTFEVGDRIPGGGRVVSTQSTFALITGVILFSMAYLPAAYFGVASNRDKDRVLLAPLVGPWIDLAGREDCVPPPEAALVGVDPCIEETGYRVAIIASGVGQILGGVMLAIGIPSRAEIVDTPARRSAVRAVPQISPRFLGVGVSF